MSTTPSAEESSTTLSSSSTTPSADPSDLAGYTNAAWSAYNRIKRDRAKRLQSYALLKAVSYARDLMAMRNGQHIPEQDRKWLRSIFADTEPDGAARNLWTVTKSPEAVQLVDYLRRQGHL